MSVLNKFLSKLIDATLTFFGIFSYNFYLKFSQYNSFEKNYAYQNKMIGRLLNDCKNHKFYSPIFKKYGVDLNASDAVTELKKLPILLKSDVKKNYEKFLPMNPNNNLKFTTSGTTGQPMSFYTSSKQWINEQGIIWRHWLWAGYQFRDKMAIFRSYAPKEGEPLIKKDFFRNWTYFSVFNMTDSDLSCYFEYIKKWKPKYLRGYPSSLEIVAEYAIKNDIKYKGFSAAFTASEVLSVKVRDKLKQAFGIEVFDHYGQAEISCMFHECEKHIGYHYNMEYGFVELIKNKEGMYRIIATNLHNNVMPLLRYDTGDLTSSDFLNCSCKRELPIIKDIVGRNDGFLYLKDKSRVSTVNIYTFFSKLNNVNRFQVIQRIPGQIDLALELNVLTDISKNMSLIKTDLENLTTLKVNLLEHGDFILSRDGKFSTFCLSKL